MVMTPIFMKIRPAASHTMYPPCVTHKKKQTLLPEQARLSRASLGHGACGPKLYGTHMAPGPTPASGGAPAGAAANWSNSDGPSSWKKATAAGPRHTTAAATHGWRSGVLLRMSVMWFCPDCGCKVFLLEKMEIAVRSVPRDLEFAETWAASKWTSLKHV